MRLRVSCHQTLSHRIIRLSLSVPVSVGTPIETGSWRNSLDRIQSLDFVLPRGSYTTNVVSLHAEGVRCISLYYIVHLPRRELSRDRVIFRPTKPRSHYQLRNCPYGYIIMAYTIQNT